MNVKEMVETIKEKPDITIEDVLKRLPTYNLQLHRNQWMATVLKHTPEPTKSRLKKEYSELNQSAKLKDKKE